MTNYFDKLSKNFDTYLSYRNVGKFEDVKALVKQAHYKPDGYTMSEEKIILQFLDSNKMLPPATQDTYQHQKLFYFANFGALVLGGVSCLLPYLVKEFHTVSPGKKNIVKLGLFFGTYGAILYPFYKLRRMQNQRLIAQNIHKIKGINQVKQPSTD